MRLAESPVRSHRQLCGREEGLGSGGDLETRQGRLMWLIFIVHGVYVCKFANSRKFVPSSRYLRCFYSHSQACAERQKILSLLPAPSQWVEQGGALPVSASYSGALLMSIWCCAFHVCVLFPVISLFKTAPSTVLRCGVVFLSAGRLGHALWRKYVG